MKRLLVLLVLFPAALFGQTRRRGLIDSVKTATATQLQGVTPLLGSVPGTRVEHVDVIDSGEYVTIVARVHVAKADVIAPVSCLPALKLQTKNIIAGIMDPLTVPPLPPVMAEAEIITALPPLPAINVRQNAISVIEMNTIAVPPLPPVVPEAEIIPALPSLPAIKVKKDAVTAVEMSVITVPPLPPPVVVDETIPALTPAALLLFKIVDIPAPPVPTIMAVPPLPEVPGDELRVLAIVKITVAGIPPETINAVALPGFNEKKMPVEEMHLSEEGYSLLEKLEGFSPELYSLKDGGFTIGFGFFVPYGEGNKWNKGVSWDEAQKMIRQKVPAYEDQVKQYINVPLTQNEFDALTMLAYNLGGFSKATSIVNDVNNEAGFAKLQSDWNRFVHSKAPNVTRGLINRRKDELGVRKYADYQPERKIQIFKVRK